MMCARNLENKPCFDIGILNIRICVEFRASSFEFSTEGLNNRPDLFKGLARKMTEPWMSSLRTLSNIANIV